MRTSALLTSILAGATLFAHGTSSSAATPSCSAMSLGAEASLNGFRPFPSTDAWNTDISTAPVDARSASLISFIGTSTKLHPDFGAGTYNGTYMGIPYVVVSNQAFVNLKVTAYPQESDPGPMPIPPTAPIEGDPNPQGDAHVLVLDRDNCWLYELWGAKKNSTNNGWTAGSSAVWDLLYDEQRPWTWTSSDAAGLSVFAGLIRYDEVAAGHIDHAIRYTLPYSAAAFVPPASHWASTSSNANAAPMGMRMRLKSSYDISSFPPQSKVILAALKKYGMIMADNGSAIYLSGTPDNRWNNDDLGALKNVPASAFEVIQMNPLYTSSNVPTGPLPAISAFTASATTVKSGTAVTLNWTTSNTTYTIVSPQIGAIRGNSVVVKPKQTTTYTLYATGPYGRSQKTVKITVQ